MGDHVQKTVNNRLTEDEVKALNKLGKKLLKKYLRYKRKHKGYHGPVNYLCKLVKKGNLWEWENPPPDYLKYLEKKKQQKKLTSYDGAVLSPSDYIRKYLIKNLEEITYFNENNEEQPSIKLAWYWLNRCRFYSVSPKFRLKVKENSSSLKFVGSFRKDEMELYFKSG